MLLSTIEELNINKKYGCKVIHNPSEIKEIVDEVLVVFSNGALIDKNLLSKLVDTLDQDNNAGTCMKKPIKTNLILSLKYMYENIRKPANNADLLFYCKKNYFDFEDSWGRTLWKLVSNAQAEKKFSVVRSFVKV